MSVFLAAYFSIFSSLASSGNVARYLENLQKTFRCRTDPTIASFYRIANYLYVILNNIVVPESDVRMPANSWFAHDVISCHWAPSWLTLQITSAVYSEVLVSVYYFIVSFSVL